MNIRKFVICAALASTVLWFSSSQADELIYSGFMSDYTQLEKVTDGTADYRYVAPDGEDKMAQFNAVMIDQPEIFIANDSPYRGAMLRYRVHGHPGSRTDRASRVDQPRLPHQRHGRRRAR